MKCYFKQHAKWICMLGTLLFSFGLKAQEDDNEFTLDAQLVTRGELRAGGFKGDSLDAGRMSHFVLGKYRITADYKRSWLEVKLSPQFSGIWGQGTAGLNLYEGWARLQTKQSLFVQLGRQELDYDNGRIIGNDDWTMTAPTHDVLKLGYDGERHKVHLMAAYNQDADNMDNGNTYYSGGLQPYKSMQALWYHYDTSKKMFGVSLLGMNIGMQSVKEKEPDVTYYQQLVGTYLAFRRKYWSLEGEFYYQMGRQEHGLPIDAFMGSVKTTVTPSEQYSLFAGYDYLSGDKFFAVPAEGNLGMVQHDVVRGFNAIFGSHHQFYGAMDFFYLDNFYKGFTPGLQNLYIGGDISPVDNLSLNAAYHYYAIATELNYLDSKTLGHEIDFFASYAFSKAVSVSAGYAYMHGSETMTILQEIQEVTEQRRLHWGWVMLSVKPTLFSTTWQDKKNK